MLPWMYEGKIYVPKDGKGYNDCEYGITSNNIEVFSISPAEYEKLENAGVIAKLNSIDEVMIDRFESDYIPYSALKKCLSLFRENHDLANCEFAKAIKTGLNLGFGIFTDL